MYRAALAPATYKWGRGQHDLSQSEHLSSLLPSSDSFIEPWHRSRYLTLTLRDLTLLVLSWLW